MSDDGLLVCVLLVMALPFAWLGLFLLSIAGSFTFWAWVVICAGIATFLTGSSWAAVAALAVGGVTAHAHRQRAQQRLQQARAFIERHAGELAIRRAQLVRTGAYGVVDRKAWDAEIGRFIADVLAPAVGGLSPLGDAWSTVCEEVERAAAGVPVTMAFRPDLSPIEYEAFVAETLHQHGWDARLTKASGDQGVDVLATKGALRVVVQCKLYGRPVGNAAVQEAIAGQRFEQATHAAVVSNQGYTRAAQQLASAAGVLLLHHDELPLLDARLFGPAAVGQLAAPAG